jgi:hypothetical protein
LLGVAFPEYKKSNRLRRRMSIACLIGFAVLLVVFGQCSTTTQFYMIAPIPGALAFGYTPLLMAGITTASGSKSAGAAAGLTKSFSLALATLAAGPILAVVFLLFLRPHPASLST